MSASKPYLVVLTGATRGLGRALLAELDAGGYTVAGCGRRTETIRELAKEVDKRHLLRAVNVADAQAVEAWAEEVVERLGAPRLVINNAALMNDPAPLWKVPAKEFGAIVDVNVKGTVNVIRAFLPAMIAARRGLVVNLSSGWGRSTSAEVAPYCATKWAVEGLTKALAQELPAGLAVVALNPGIINTEMLQQCWADAAGSYESAEEWAPRALDTILRLTTQDNGKSLNV